MQATSAQGPQCITAGHSLDPSKAVTAGSAELADEDAQSAYSIEEEDPLSKGPLAATSSMHPPPQHPETSQQTLQADSDRGITVTAAAKLSQIEDLQDVEVLEGAMAHDGSRDSSGHKRHHAGELQHQQSTQSVQSVSSTEVLDMGMQWLQYAYKAWTAENETTVLPILPAVPESLHAVRNLLSGMLCLQSGLRTSIMWSCMQFLAAVLSVMG